MSVPSKFETSLLKHPELETVMTSHHPAIYDATLDDLKDLRQRLRDLSDKERTMARAKRREMRGKGAARGASFPGTAERSFERKQMFVAALKRVNKEIVRRENMAARAANIEAAHRTLAMLRAAQFPPRPAAEQTPHEERPFLPSRLPRTKVPGAKIGSISQATRNAQAVRDARN